MIRPRFPMVHPTAPPLGRVEEEVSLAVEIIEEVSLAEAVMEAATMAVRVTVDVEADKP